VTVDARLSELLAPLIGGAPLPADAARLDSIPGMDSLKFMELVSALEEMTGEVDLEALASVETVGDLRRLLEGA
jgi:acyl carrier protein